METELGPLLAFAARSRVADGFGWLDTDGTVVDRPTETWISARMTHVFSLAALLDRPGAMGLAEHGARTLAGGPLHDSVHGGWRSTTADDVSTPTSKTAYVHAFVLLAASTAVLADVPGAGALLDEALEVWDSRFFDPVEGLARESFSGDWSMEEPYRGVNANMHGVEAMLAAADAVPRPVDAARLREQALRATERIVHGWAREHDGRLPEHFGPHWTPLPEYNAHRPADPFRPYGVTVGHQFEWSRLCLHLDAALGDRAPGWLRTDSAALFTAAAARGWAADGHPGFPYTLDQADRAVVGARMHWVLCEAIAAAAVRHRVTGDPTAVQLQRDWEAHGDDYFLDRSTGSWHHELTPDGEVSAATWSGQPDVYHLAQLLLLRDQPVRGSLAAALLH